MMVTGVDFTERFSPVVTDEGLKTQLAINLKSILKVGGHIVAISKQHSWKED